MILSFGGIFRQIDYFSEFGGMMAAILPAILISTMARMLGTLAGRPALPLTFA